MLLPAGIAMVAASTLIPVAIIGVSEAAIIVSSTIDIAGSAIISTPTGASLAKMAIGMTNITKDELTNVMNNILIYGPSFGVGAIQGFSTPSPSIIENWTMFWGFITGLGTSEAINK